MSKDFVQSPSCRRTVADPGGAEPDIPDDYHMEEFP